MKEKNKKFRVIKDSEDEKIHIVLSQKTTFINQFNNHKYLNDKKTRNIRVLHKNKNWKDISQASLDNIQLPSDVTKFSEINYKDLIFNFLTVTGQVISIPLNDGLDADIHTILSESFNPSFFRTNFPAGLFGSHLSDFVTVVLYELYSNADLLDELVSSIVLPKDYIEVLGSNYHFEIVNVEHNMIQLSVTDDDGEPVSVDEWGVDTERKIVVNNQGYTIQLDVAYYDYIEDETGQRIIEDPTAEKTIEYYNFNNNIITLMFNNGTFKLFSQRKVLIVQIEHDNDDTIHLIRFLSMNIEKNGYIAKLKNDWELVIPVVSGVLGGEVTLSARVNDPSNNEHNGNIRFYLENNGE